MVLSILVFNLLLQLSQIKGSELASNKSSTAVEFVCGSTANKMGGVSIPMKWRCDGQVDCDDQSDEKDCDHIQCEDPSHLQCLAEGGRKMCIPPTWKCDGQIDCTDGTDEKDCKEKKHCGNDEFDCGNTECIYALWQSDGECDCSNGADEKNCTMAPAFCNAQTMFKCKSGDGCIALEWRCDGVSDCQDRSDEKGCAATEHTCKLDTDFACKSRNTCIDKQWVCDGEEDCPDGSDERDCKEGKEKCKEAERQCAGSKKCISGKLWCNGIEDCSAGEDEDVCYHPENKIHANQCTSYGRCDQICESTNGSFKCSCHRGYQLVKRLGETIPSRCRAMGDDPLLLLSNRAQITQFNMATDTHLPLIQSPGSAVAMDYHMDNQSLIWYNDVARRIMMCKVGTLKNERHLPVLSRSEMNEESLAEGSVSTPSGLAVDWVYDLLFWTDAALDTISVMDLNTRKRRILFANAGGKPRSIAVDPQRGLIFWCDCSTPARIERSGMDGDNRRVIHKGKNVKWPMGLAVDLVQERIYWADAKIKAIFSSDYNGKDVRVVLNSNSLIGNPISLSIFEDRVFYTDWNRGGVVSVNKFTGSLESTLLKSVRTPTSVKIYHRSSQPSHPNECSNSGCPSDTLCLPRDSDTPLFANSTFSCKRIDNEQEQFGNATTVSSTNGSSLPSILTHLLVLSVIIGC